MYFRDCSNGLLWSEAQQQQAILTLSVQFILVHDVVRGMNPRLVVMSVTWTIEILHNRSSPIVW